MRAKWRRLLGEEITGFIVAVGQPDQMPSPDELDAWKATYNRPASRGGLHDDSIAADARMCLQIARSMLHDGVTTHRFSEQQLAVFNISRTRAATDARVARKAERVARARALRAEGLSAPMIAIRMAREVGRDPDANPFSERQVRRWLADKKG